MLRFSRRRRLPLLRVLVLVLFALGSVLQPVMAAAGEMHELAHDPSGMHSDGLRIGAVDADLAVAGTKGRAAAGILHALLHFAHCCATTAALLPGLAAISSTPASGGPAIAPAPTPPQTGPASPFKPPISG